MTHQFTKDDVFYFANFAWIEFSDEEAEQYAEQLSELDKFAERFEEVDTANVQPMTHPLHQVNVLREDVPTEILNRDEMLASVKEHEDGMIKVPNILS